MIADVFEVLADPTRRRLIQALRVGEHSVNDLVKVAEINQPGVSKQLRMLHDAGFVQVRPDRQRRLYSLRSEPFRELDSWMEDYRHLWEERFDRLAAQLEARKQRQRSDLASPGDAGRQASRSGRRSTRVGPSPRTEA